MKWTKCKRWIAGYLLCVAFAVNFVACQQEKADADAGASTGNATVSSESAVASTSSQTQPTEVESWFAQIDTVTLDGKPITGGDFSDNVLTVFNVWATWCAPCVEELPYLQEVSEKFQDQRVEIVGVMQDGVTEQAVEDKDTIAQGQALLTEAGVQYTVVLPDEMLRTTFVNQMQYFPTTFFVDSNGVVVDTVIGSQTAESWEETIHEVLDKVS